MHEKKKSILIGLLTGVANGLFGSGGGTIVVPCMQKFLDIKTHKSHATAIAIILPLSILSAGIYLFKVDVDWMSALWVSLGGIFGGYLGARLLKKIKGRYLHIIFGLFMIVAAARMIL